MLISPLYSLKINYTPFKINSRQVALNFKGQLQADTFEKTSETPKLKRGQILDCGEIYISSSTQFFRDDIDWNKFSRYLEERFKNNHKVNTYDYACSDGSEAYSLSMMLQHKFKDDAEKFFPICAKDIDENSISNNIENQKTGAINKSLGIKQIANVLDTDKAEIKENFVQKTKQRLASQPEYVSALKENVTKPVIFEEANILEDIENIDSKNPSVIMCRNMWPYVESSEYKDFANTLYERLKEGSIVVLGAFDCFLDKIEEHDNKKISKALTNAGFTPSKTIVNPRGHNLIFEKNSKENTLSFKGLSDFYDTEIKNPKLKRGQMMNKKGEIFTRPQTDMFRTDMDWNYFGQYIKERFADEDKVNTLVYACSTGAEPYTLSTLMQHTLKDNAEKFFPIQAKDIDENIIRENISNQNGGTVMKDSYLSTRYCLGLNHNEARKYVTLERIPDSSFEIERLTDTVTSPVQFSCANILDDIENIDSKNPSIVMCRNMWPYVNPDEYEEFAIKLYDKLKKGSVVVLGNYDFIGETGMELSKTFPENLMKAGFDAIGKTGQLTKGTSLIFEKN